MMYIRGGWVIMSLMRSLAIMTAGNWESNFVFSSPGEAIACYASTAQNLVARGMLVSVAIAILKLRIN